ncbi:DNA gyrase subunit A [Candidatus Chlamydia sanziniae]|uniref:Topoisomerase IV subunit A n=1 Tax=Candidatus Chlamydia sanziniae TaxID=1806891 RepID=A0A1A9HWQ9_9CHLA|nr:DNA gyrase subunit A [Candidatus Chlamydia sanziniae]ANH78522.1 Topoisomerase IV subunit A [Candidatus Chlamydia sanziniae]
MCDISDLFKLHFMHYASYVILERAIPHILDGLKPVQRRLLWTLFLMDNGKMHKVANIAGRTMAFHPHGDAPITEALVVLANKGYLIDTQGNFGNPITGDPHAAARYIEARLSPLARETLFNTQLMSFQNSYDSREKEPVVFPAKLPLLLLHGVDGIAVGMTTKIFPHNFTELLKAQIAILNNRHVTVLPDFPSGGIMDARNYQDGLGSVTIRVSIDIVDDKTLIIKEICPLSTTETLIRSIENAAKRGILKIDSIQDFSTHAPYIEIKLPKGTYASEILPPLFEHTECEVVLHSKPTAIYNNQPIESSISEILKLHTESLQKYLQKELQLLYEQLSLEHHYKILEYIFIKHKLYDQVRDSLSAQNSIASSKDVHEAVLSVLDPWLTYFSSPLTKQDTTQLASLTIKKILCFNEEAYTKELKTIEKKQAVIQKDLNKMKQVTIKYLKNLLERYSTLGVRKTQIASFSTKAAYAGIKACSH